jgi:DNA mismatch repair protein MutS
MSTETIYDKYFNYETTYKKHYGSKTIVLMMVGSFFEVYGPKNDPDAVIHDFARICQMNISEKKKVLYNSSPVLMAGFPEYTLERYVQKLSDAGYTSVVIVQDEENSVQGGKKKHMVHSICSPGTYIGENVSDTVLSNNIMCIWLHTYIPVRTHKVHLICGISVVNIFTGQSHIYEYKVPLASSRELSVPLANAPSRELLVPLINDSTVFDELERAISVHCPSEVILLYKDKSLATNAIKYSGITTEAIHTYNVTEDAKAENAQKQQYIEHMLETFFGEEFRICAEFSMYQIGTQSYCYLLNFIQEHNPSLVKRISCPVFSNPSTNVILANSTLKQLNIIDDNSLDGVKAGRCSSVLNFVNRCCTAMGKRNIQTLLCNPVYNAEWLQKEYDIVEHVLLEHDYLIGFARQQLQHVMDIEKLERCIYLRKVPPLSLFKLAESLDAIQQTYVCLAENQRMLDYIGCDQLLVHCSSVLQTLRKYLNMDACKNGIVQMNAGINDELDAINIELNAATTTFNTIHGFFNMAMQCTQDSDADFVRVNTTEKSGSTLQITKVRAKVLKQVLETGNYMAYPCFKGTKNLGAREQSSLGKYKVEYKNTTIDFSDIKFVNATGSNDEIRFKQLDDVCASVLRLENALARKNAELYNDFITNILTDIDLAPFIQFVVKLDTVICKTYLAKEFRLCKPTLDTRERSSLDTRERSSLDTRERSSLDTRERSSLDTRERSSLEAKQLRHLLIEQIQQNETYVANDVTLGQNGILLYGTNAVGKTSLIRAIGIAVILAQSGFYVPCAKFAYSPFKSIYTRILGNDNLYKGLSTFAVEMSELRVILKNADSGSLILGDELCSGTETQSALSIFMAGLQTLSAKKSSFIFATHFHEIIEYDELKALNNVQLKHMAVHYDPASNKLVYDRLLRDGPGDNMYGLEVCKSLHMPADFMEAAFQLRNKYFPVTSGILTQPVSHYNASKIRGLCEKCGTKMSTEVHHILEQHKADKNGFIEGTAIKKNHKANLVALCEACHLLEHKK